MVPKCPYFGECGGCSTQHISYELQLENKHKALMQRFPLKEIPVFSGAPYGYRNRMDFSIGDGPGLRKKNHFDRIVPVRRCEICNERLNALLAEVWQWHEKHRDVPGLSYVVIRTSEHTQSSTVSFVFAGPSHETVRDFAQVTTAENVVIALTENGESVSSDCHAVKGSLMMQEMICGKPFSYHSQGFFQNNTMMAEKMVAHVKEIASRYDTKSLQLLDLYGGVGTFGLSVADRFKEVLVAESVPESIRCAEMNIKEQGISNARAVCLDAASVNRLKLARPFIITDPPRSGMAQKALERMISLNAPVIVYVSCNPIQFSKELKVLGKRYALTSLAMFDLFPQTNHIECVAELRMK
jgi:23S rRNA (uracil1939-C5)-methyltransferase